MNIETIITQSESKILEFKENTKTKDKILATVIAFANSSGGKLILGLEDQTKLVKGIQNPYAEEESMVSFLLDSIKPFAFINVEILPWRETHLLIIDVPMSTTGPHYIKSKGIKESCYVRVGSSNRLADDQMIESIRGSLKGTSYDEESCLQASSADIDFESLRTIFHPFKELTETDLLTLGIINKRGDSLVPSNGGILFSGRNKRQIFPDAWIQAGCFQGKTKTTIIDSYDIHGYFNKTLDDSINFIRKHISVGIRIGDIIHTEQWEIPKEALRETVLNALVHADYNLRGAPLRICIFDDRIEIENPGLITRGLTLDDIKGGLSKVRNRVLMRIARELKMTEQWGSGIGRIIESCKLLGLKEPKFEEIGYSFRVTLYREKIASEHLDEISKKIIDFLKQDGAKQTHEIAKALNMSSRSMQTRLKKLIEMGKIVTIGSNSRDPHKKFMVR